MNALMRRAVWLCSLSTAWTSGCEKTKQLARDAVELVVPEPSGGGAPEPVVAKQRLRVDLLEQLKLCEVRYRGLFIDVSSEQSDAYRSFAPPPFDDVRRVRRAGFVSGEVLLGRLSYDIWLDKPAADVALTLKGQQGSAAYVTAYVDGKRVGAGKLGEKSAAVVELGSISDELSAGRHSVDLRFAGRGAQPGDMKAALQWIRVHFASDRDARYSAPSWDNLVVDAELGGVPRRSVALRAPGSVRCGLVPVAGTRVRIDVGYWGEGAGSAAVRVRTADGETVTLAEQHVTGGEDSKWVPLDLTLDAFTDQLIALELSADDTGVGGRVVFGEPHLERAVVPQELAPARFALLIVAGGLERRLLPPWGPREGLQTFFELSQQGVVFEGYRSSATTVNGVVASLLSGLRPSAHGVVFAAARLPSEVPLLSEAVRKRDGRAAMFTNVPYSFEAFGFDRGWDKFASYSPVEDRPASEPVLHGRDWLEPELAKQDGTPRLLVLHLSAAHPPWDVSQDEAKVLPPEEYNGIVEPRRAAMALREVRNRNRAARRILGPNDWVRVEALQSVALKKLDTALGSLVSDMKRAGVWDQTLVVLVGDLGMGDRSEVPFDPQGGLEEARLSVPLIVKFPGGRQAGSTVRDLTDPEAVAATIAGALGVAGELRTPEAPLDALLDPPMALQREARFARQGDNYVLYLGRYRLTGTFGRMPQLCDLEVDPTCGYDLAVEQPFVVQWMWRVGLPEFSADVRVHEDEDVLVEPDSRTQNALNVYGL